MPYASLADFLEELDRCGQLARVEVEVDCELEIAEITRRVAGVQGPALLFERTCRAARWRSSRTCWAPRIGCAERWVWSSLDDLMARTESLVQKYTPQNWFDRLRSGADESGAAKFRPRPSNRAYASRSCDWAATSSWASLPILKQWPTEIGTHR